MTGWPGLDRLTPSTDGDKAPHLWAVAKRANAHTMGTRLLGLGLWEGIGLKRNLL